MGSAVFDRDNPFLEQPLRAGVVLCRTEYGNLHAGVIHHDRRAVSFLHLGWEDRMSESWYWERLWAAPDVPAPRLFSVAAKIRLVLKRFQQNKSFPYQLRFAGTHFDQNGQLQFGPGSTGLTCATFVLAIFKSEGIDLVKEDTWDVREEDDREFLEQIRSFASSGHFARLEAEVDQGCIRVRPAEVLGACACSLPASFGEVLEHSQRAEEMLPQIPVSDDEEE